MAVLGEANCASCLALSIYWSVSSDIRLNSRMTNDPFFVSVGLFQCYDIRHSYSKTSPLLWFPWMLYHPAIFPVPPALGSSLPPWHSCARTAFQRETTEQVFKIWKSSSGSFKIVHRHFSWVSVVGRLACVVHMTEVFDRP